MKKIPQKENFYFKLLLRLRKECIKNDTKNNITIRPKIITFSDFLNPSNNNELNVMWQRIILYQNGFDIKKKFETFLNQHKCYDEYSLMVSKNHDKRRKSIDNIFLYNMIQLFDLIMDAFTWANSSKGSYFWSQLHSEWSYEVYNILEKIYNENFKKY